MARVRIAADGTTRFVLREDEDGIIEETECADCAAMDGGRLCPDCEEEAEEEALAAVDEQRRFLGMEPLTDDGEWEKE